MKELNPFPYLLSKLVGQTKIWRRRRKRKRKRKKKEKKKSLADSLAGQVS
jgi:hypothetical protein